MRSPTWTFVNASCADAAPLAARQTRTAPDRSSLVITPGPTAEAMPEPSREDGAISDAGVRRLRHVVGALDSSRLVARPPGSMIGRPLPERSRRRAGHVLDRGCHERRPVD